VQVTGEKGGRFMKNKIKYTNEPMGELRAIKDFLPPPVGVNSGVKSLQSVEKL
jgi:hypothetical protein